MLWNKRISNGQRRVGPRYRVHRGIGCAIPHNNAGVLHPLLHSDLLDQGQIDNECKTAVGRFFCPIFFRYVRFCCTFCTCGNRVWCLALWYIFCGSNRLMPPSACPSSPSIPCISLPSACVEDGNGGLYPRPGAQ